jgi:hypothetical protein
MRAYPIEADTHQGQHLLIVAAANIHQRDDLAEFQQLFRDNAACAAYLRPLAEPVCLVALFHRHR